MFTINSLNAAESVLIPFQAQYLPAKVLEQLLKTINKVRKQLNPKLKIDGILLTMTDAFTNDAKEISKFLRDTYGEKLKVFDSVISHSVRAAEFTSFYKSVFAHDQVAKYRSKLHPFKTHPFNVIHEAALLETVDSIIKHSILVSIIARHTPTFFCK